MHFEKGREDEDRARCYKGLAQIGVAEKKFKIALDDAQTGLHLAQETGSRSLTMDFYLFPAILFQRLAASRQGGKVRN